MKPDPNELLVIIGSIAVLTTAFCALVFVAGLKLPIPLCPDLESLQTVALCRG